MKYFGVYLFLLFGLSSYCQEDTTAYGKMLDTYYKRTIPFIQPQELYDKIIAGETIYILDTREKREYKISTIKGGIHVGFLFFSIKRVKKIDKNSLIVTFCTIGARSETIGERLLKKGYQNIYNLYGGIIYWKNQGFPVYKNDEKTDNVHVYSKKWGKWLTKGKAHY